MHNCFGDRGQYRAVFAWFWHLGDLLLRAVWFQPVVHVGLERLDPKCDVRGQLLVQPVEWAALWHNHGWVWELQQRRKLQVAYCFSFNHTPFFLLLQY